MLNLEDSKTLISAYRFIEKNCDLIDEFVYRHSINFGPSPEYYSTFDVTNNIIDLIERKNRLINLKLMIDELINTLSIEDRKIILAKMRYNLSMRIISQMFQISSLRTAFRRMNKALQNFTMHANNSRYKERLERVIDDEYWISNIRKSIQEINICG